ncbi:MAG TPA: hypothetical protein VKA55_03215, partial [Gammaproteobacteria bacterium]|nr:hypothetical protein [Gammaproteobacteria bacterium]
AIHAVRSWFARLRAADEHREGPAPGRPRLAAATAAAVGGFAAVLLVPAAALVAFVSLVVVSIHAGSLLAWTGAATLAVAASVATAASLYLLGLRPRQPVGYTLTLDEAPALFALIEEVCHEYRGGPLSRAPVIHRLCVTGDYELAAVAVPRSAIPFAHRNTLVVGLPVLQTVTPSQFEALLSRQLAMLSGRDAPLTGALVRLRRSWFACAAAPAARPAFLHRLIMPLVGAYARFYGHLSRPLAMAYREAADQAALARVSSEDMVDGMVAYEVGARFVARKFWPTLERLADRVAKPPRLPYETLEQAFLKGVRPRERRSWLQAALRDRTRRTTPPLDRRIAHLSNNPPRLPAMPTVTAAREYLAETAGLIERHLDQRWLKANLGAWERRYSRRRMAERRIRTLRERAESRSLNGRELKDFLGLVRRYVDRPRAGALYKALLPNIAGNPRANFVVGRLLLGCGDAEGIIVLEKAMALDSRYTAQACALIAGFKARRTATQVA